MPQDTPAGVAGLLKERFGVDASGVGFAPGRVNIIGEHTDYNDGFAFPAAVNLATFVAFCPREDGRVRIFSDASGEEVEFELEAAAGERLPFWARYVWGTGMSLLEEGLSIDGFDGYALATVPGGGGLSSSASFEIALAYAYLGPRAREVEPLDLVRICRRAENAYVGVNCGMMDQFSSIFGSEGHALMLDCRSLEYRNVSFPEAAVLVVADTGVRHALGESGYHDRQEECRKAVEILSAANSGVRALRDVTMAMLEEDRNALGDVLYRRARHVVTEDERVLAAADAMASGDLERLGALMSESHASLQRDYEVSCGELDLMVESAEGLDGHYGTRMTGGGFGGCTVSLVERGAAEGFVEGLSARYSKKTGREGGIHVVHPGRGAGLIETELGVEDV